MNRSHTQNCGIIPASSHEQQRLFQVQLFRQFQNLIVQLKNLIDLIGQHSQTLDDFTAPRLHRYAILAHDQCKHDKRYDLTSVCLGRCHANFRSCVDVHTAMTFSANTAAHCIGDSNDQGPVVLAVAQSQKRVRSLARLWNKKTHVISENGRASVQKITGQLNHDRQFSEFLQDLASSNNTVVTCATTNQQQSSAPFYLRNKILDTSEYNRLRFKVDSTSHGVDHRFRLFKNFLLHKGTEIAFHDLLNFHFQGDDFTGQTGRRSIQITLQSVKSQTCT